MSDVKGGRKKKRWVYIRGGGVRRKRNKEEEEEKEEKEGRNERRKEKEEKRVVNYTHAKSTKLLRSVPDLKTTSNWPDINNVRESFLNTHSLLIVGLSVH